MSEPLRITELHADAFGGLKDTRLELGSEPFVVVAGNNETGKSSMTTLLSWLLVGPYGDAAFAQRFGNDGSQIGGTLYALLGDDPVTSEGSFKVPRRGAPKPDPVITLRGASFDAAAWCDKVLRGIDSEVLEAIYVMAGADLHQGMKVRKGIATLAVAGMSGAGGALVAVGRLDEMARKSITAGGSAESFKTISTQSKKVDRSISDLRTDVADYSATKDTIAGLEENQEGISPQLVELQAQLNAIDAVAELQLDLENAATAESELRDLAEVAAPWMAVVEPEVGFERLLDDLDTAQSQLADKRGEFDDACAELGLSPVEGMAVQVSAIEITSATQLTQTLALAGGALASATTAETDCRGSLNLAIAELNNSLAGHDLDVDALRSVSLADGDSASLSEAVGQMDAAETALSQAVADVKGAETQRELANSALGRALEAWNAFHPDITPEKWLTNPSVGSTPTAPSGTNAVVVPVAFSAAAVIAVVAIAAAPPAIAALVTALAFVAAYFVVRVARPALSGGNVTEDPAVRDAADNAIAAMAKVASADGAVEEAGLSVARTQEDLDERSSRVDQLTQAAGFTASGDAAKRRRKIEAIKVAAAVVQRHDGATDAFDTARDNRESASSAVDEAIENLRSALSGWGIPERLDHNSAAMEIAKFQEVTRCNLAVSGALTARDEAQGAFDICAKPVAEEIAGLNFDGIRKVFTAQRSATDERARITSDRDRSQQAVDRRLESNDRAQALATENLLPDDLALRREDVSGEKDRLEAERNKIVQEVADLRAALKEAEKKDALADLHLELGSLNERADQCLISGAVAVLAASVLKEVAEEQRQQNQPALITRATELLQMVVPEWEQLRVDPTDSGDLAISVRRTDGTVIPGSRLSTGAQALLYLALRLAAAEQDAESRRGGLRFPILCDDPLVHFDDDRALAAAQLLASASAKGHQVILFTCHKRTEQAALAAGASIKRIG